jgi:hypothetical protein
MARDHDGIFELKSTPAVIAREGGRSGIPERPEIESEKAAAYWIPACAAMTI